MYKNKKILISSLVILLSLLLPSCGAKQKTRIEYTTQFLQPLSYCIINKQGCPCPALVELLHLTTPELKTALPEELTLPRIVEVTQRAWLRPSGAERWHIQEKEYADRDCMSELLNQLCLCKEMNPHKAHYNYCFIFGATATTIRTRIAYMLHLWEKGVRFDTLIFLGSERPLDATQESFAVLVDREQTILPIRCNWQQNALPTTETEMMKFIFNQAELPEAFDQITIEFVNTPMQEKEDGSLRRPNTGDTIAHWLASDPVLGSCLFISNQPYVGYQDTVARTYMPSAFEIDTVGSSIPCDSQNIDIALDTLARWLYQENLRRKSK